MKKIKPESFAESYIKDKLSDITQSNVIFRYSNLASNIKDENVTFVKKEIHKLIRASKLKTIRHLKLPLPVEIRLYKALFELTFAAAFPKYILKNKIKRLTKQREDAIMHLKQIVNNSVISGSLKKSIVNEIIRLKQYDKGKQTYSSIKEIEYIEAICMREHYQKMIKEELKKYPEKASLLNMSGFTYILRYHGRNISKVDRKLLMLKDLYKEANLKVISFLNLSSKFPEGSPNKLFYKALQIVVFKILAENTHLPTEKVKIYSANIINEYKDKQGYKKLKTLTSKDIDNALHSS